MWNLSFSPARGGSFQGDIMASEIKNLKILLVDNQSEIRNMREYLRELGFNSVSEMSNGLQVLTEIKNNRPDMMFVNCNLPKYSGIQVYNSMQADKSLASIKFVMVTPRLNRRETADMENLGVTHILQRPFTTEEMKEKIYSLLGFSLDDLKEGARMTAQEAKEAFDRGDFEQACNLYHESAETCADADYFYMQGRCYLELDLVDQAIAALQNAIKTDHKHPEADYWLGIALQRKKEYAESVRSLKRASKRRNATADTHVALGKSHLGAKQDKEADQAFGSALKMDPDNVDIRTKVGNAYLEHEKYARAEEAFGEALDINPENIHLYNRMAIALRKQGKYADAINLYIKAIGIAPKDEGLYYNLARALHESGERPKAIKALGKALKLDPEFEEAKTLLQNYMAEQTQGDK